MSQKTNLNQLSLPFDALKQRAFGEGRSRALSYEDRTKVFWFLAGVCFFSLVIYVYAVNATARNVALRASLEREATELNADLATLEFQYIALTGDVTLALAQEYGFSEVKEPLYVSQENVSSLSFNSQNP